MDRQNENPSLEDRSNEVGEIVRQNEKHYIETHNQTYTELELCHSEMNQHMQIKHNNGPPYICDFCTASFRHKSTFEIHKARKHLPKTYLCHICSKLFGRPEDLDKHLQIHSEEKPYSCNVCSKSFKMLQYLQLHSHVHTELPYACRLCGKRYRVLHTCKDHELKSHEETCTICRKQFVNSLDLQTHIKINHPRKMVLDMNKKRGKLRGRFACNDCGKRFTTFGGRKHHELKKHDKTCDLCPKKFLFNSDLEKHKQMKHPKKFLKNEYMDIGIDYNNISKHFDVRRYTCEICRAKFTTISLLKQHLIKHLGGPYECDECSSRFRCKQRLIVHKRNKHPICQFCSEKFNGRLSLKKHMQTKHSNERPFSCDMCSAKFKEKGKLNRHKKFKHSDERPFSCEVCSATFKDKNSLNIHRKIHSTERPYACDECPSTYVTKSDLKKHK